jgi:multimeric flavodoxin WrbA
MKAVGIVASPRPKGNTAYAVAKVLEGAGAEPRIFSLNGVEPCASCLACKQTAQCVKRDPMREIYAALAEAELLVLGSPIYMNHVSAQAWVFMNRLYCFLGPAPELEDRYRGARRGLLVATQGRPEPGYYRRQLDEFAGILRSYWHIKLLDHLVIGGCRRDAGLDSRPESVAALLAAGRALAGR